MDIYIANLRKGISTEMLRHTFRHLGNVTSVRIVYAANEAHEKDFAVICLYPPIETKTIEKDAPAFAFSKAV